MKARGRLTNVQVPFRAKYPVISFEIQADPEDLEKYIDKDLDINFSKHRRHVALMQMLVFGLVSEILQRC